jgi:hypothetical protein
MAKKMFLFIAVLFLFACAQIERNPVKYDQQVYINNYDRMFAAAINKGTKMAYTIDKQDKEYGVVKMSRKVGYSTYAITVKFGEDDFKVKGEIDTDLFNPFIGEDAKAMEDAIKDAVK